MIFSNKDIPIEKVGKNKRSFVFFGERGMASCTLFKVSLQLPHWFKNLRAGLTKNLTVVIDNTWGREEYKARVTESAKKELFIMLSSKDGSLKRGNGEIFVLKKNLVNFHLYSSSKVLDTDGSYQTILAKLDGPCVIRIRYSGAFKQTILDWDGAQIKEYDLDEHMKKCLEEEGMLFDYDISQKLTGINNCFNVKQWKKI